MEIKVKAGVSNKHGHLSKKDLEILFGEGYELCNKKDLVQPGQFACEETVELVGPKMSMKNVRIIGPLRPDTQFEVSMTDARALGIQAPLRESGKVEGSAGIKVIGPKGTVELKEGVIVAARHVHFHTSEGEKFGVADKDILTVKFEGERGIVFENVLARVGEGHAFEMHLDTDECNAGFIKNGDEGTIVTIAKK